MANDPLYFQAVLQQIRNNTLVDVNLGNQGITVEDISQVVDAFQNNTSVSNLELRDNLLEPPAGVLLAQMLEQNSSLKQLGLYNNRIGPAGASALADMLKINNSLERLWLDLNGIGTEGVLALADALHTNTGLIAIDFDGNKIPIEGMRAIATALQVHKNLTALYLFSTNITLEGVSVILEAAKFHPSLHQLSIGANFLDDEIIPLLVDFLKTNTKLAHLYLGRNQITNTGAAALLAVLQDNYSLHFLYLDENPIDPAYLDQIGTLLTRNKNFDTQVLTGLRNNTTVELDLSNQPISDGQINLITRYLKENTSLKILRLSDCGMTDSAAALLSEGLTNNTSVSVVDLHTNNIGPMGSEALAKMLLLNQNIEEFNISNNNIGNMGVSAIAKAAETHEKLKTLWIWGCHYNVIGAANIAHMLAISQSLEFAYLASNQIEDQGAKYIAAALEGNRKLTNIYLHTNRIGDEGAIALFHALQINHTLKGITLYSNTITDMSMTALADMLKFNDSLEGIALHQNSITNTGASGLLEALQNNYSLRFLNLDENRIDQIYLHQINALLARNTAMITALQGLKNNSITTLDLSNHQINDAGVLLLAEALRNNTSLLHLDLRGNPIGDGYGALTSALECNYVLTTLMLDANSHASEITALLARNLQCAAATLQCPVLKAHLPTVPKNSMVALSTQHLQIISNQDGHILFGDFSVIEVKNGQFVNATRQVITEFSQAAVNASDVFIRADDSGLPIHANITAQFDGVSTCALPLTFNVTDALPPSSTSGLFTALSTATTTPVSRPFSSVPVSIINTTESFETNATRGPSTTAVTHVALDKESKGINLGGLIGSITGVAAAIGVGIFCVKRRRENAQIAAASAPDREQVIGMVPNPVYEAVRTPNAKRMPWDRNEYETHEQAQVVGDPWDSVTYDIGTAASHEGTLPPAVPPRGIGFKWI